jgi:diguanylate cyclase
MRTSILPVWAQTLKFKILALTAAAAACAALGATQVVLQTTEADVQRMLMQAHGHDREQTAALFSNKIEMLQGALIAAARQIRTETWKRPDAMADTLRGNAALSTMFDVVFAAGPTGLTTARLERGEVLTGAVNLADREYFRRVMQFDQPVISRPAVDGDNRAPLVVIAVPVLARDGTTVGTVAGTLALGSNRLFASLNAAAEREGTRDLVIDRDGVILAHPQTGRLLGRAIDEPGLGPVITAWLQRGSPIDTTGEAVVSGQHLVSLAGIPHTDWLLVRMTPIDRALEPVAAARRTGWLAAAAVALFAGLLGGGLAWLMIRPISQLRLRVERLLAQAAPLDEPWPQSHGELGALSRAFRQVFERARVRQADGHALLQRLEAVLEHAEVGIALSRDGRFELVSRQLCHIFRCDPPQLIGQATSSIHASPDAYQAFSERALPDFMAKGAFDGELELMRSGGERFWAHMRGRAVTPGDRSKGTIWIIEDVTEAHAQRERLVWTASHDALTGLMNRRAFEARLGEASSRSTTPAATPPATRCCATSASCSSPRCASRTRWLAWVATNSRCCSTSARSRRPSSSPKGCALPSSSTDSTGTTAHDSASARASACCPSTQPSRARAWPRPTLRVTRRNARDATALRSVQRTTPPLPRRPGRRFRSRCRARLPRPGTGSTQRRHRPHPSGQKPSSPDRFAQAHSGRQAASCSRLDTVRRQARAASRPFTTKCSAKKRRCSACS